MPYKDPKDQKRHMNVYYQKRFYEKVKKQGLCIRCYKEPQGAETLFCEACRIKAREYQKQYSKKLRNAAYSAYGGKCLCCGESNPLLLTIDHVNGGGTQERKQLNGSGKNSVNRNFYLHLKKLGYPPDYQLLCFNCNMGRARNGGVCPHKELTN